MKHQPPLHNDRNNDRIVAISYWLVGLALLASLLYIVAIYGPDRKHYIALHNADAMFIPVFFQDVMMRGSWTGWDLPTNPYFFPDMALFFLILALVSEVHLYVILYGIAQLLLIVTGVMLLQRWLFAQNRLAHLFTLSMLTLCMLLIATGIQVFYAYALMSVHHTGVLVMIPFATLVLARVLYDRQGAGQRRMFWLLFGITFLTSLSDSLFIIQFVIPAMIASLLWAERKARSWRHLLLTNGAILLAAAGGQWLRHFVVPVDKLLIYTTTENTGEMSNSFSEFRAWTAERIASDPLFCLLWLLSVIALVSVLVISSFQRKEKARPVAMVATLTLLSALLSVAAALVTGNFKDEFSTRYILSALYLPLFVGLPLFLSMQPAITEKAMGRRISIAIISLAACLAVGYMLLTGKQITLASLTDYQDPFLACLEREAEQRNIHYGLASYWQADSTTALSEGSLEVIPVGSDLAPIFWNNNVARYQAPFEFVIINHESSGDLLIRKESVARLGQPSDTFECESSDILVYNRQSDAPIRNWFAHRPEFAKLEQVGDMTEFYGYVLPTENRGVAVGLSQGASEQWQNDAGTLAYASLLALPAGSYAVAFDLYADSANTGFWEVVDKSEVDTVVLATQPIVATGISVPSGYFTLQQEADIEIRVKYDGHGALYVDRIRIVRFDPTQAPSFRFAETAAPPDAPTDAPQQGQLSLLYPYAGSEIAHRQTDFVWQWTGQPLPKEQTFEVRLWRKGESIHYGAHDAMASRALIRQIGDTYILRLDLNGAYSIMQHGTGEYEWTVAIVATEPAYQDLQMEALPFALGIE